MSWISYVGRGRGIGVAVLTLLLVGVVGWSSTFASAALRQPPGDPAATATADEQIATTAPAELGQTASIAELLANPPTPGAVVEVDAYLSGAEAPLQPGMGPVGTGSRTPPTGVDRVLCPLWPGAVLTDRPRPSMLQLFGNWHAGPPPEHEPWLVAATPEATQPNVANVPRLPFHARLRGRLGDPAFAHCREAARVLVVEEIVVAHPDGPPPGLHGLAVPEGYAAWPWHHDAGAGYSVPYPPGSGIEALADPSVLSSMVIRVPEWPAWPIVTRAHDFDIGPGGDVRRVRDMLAGRMSAEQLGWMGSFLQDADPPWTLSGQRLRGYRLDMSVRPGVRGASVLIGAHGRTYELTFQYPTGLDASQELLNVFVAVAEGLKLDVPPPPYVPPVLPTQPSAAP